MLITCHLLLQLTLSTDCRGERGRRGRSGDLMSLLSLCGEVLGWLCPSTECQCPPKADITAELSPSRFGSVLSLTSSGLEVVTAQLLLNSYYPFFCGFPTLLPYLHKQSLSNHPEHAMCLYCKVTPGHSSSKWDWDYSRNSGIISIVGGKGTTGYEFSIMKIHSDTNQMKHKAEWSSSVTVNSMSIWQGKGVYSGCVCEGVSGRDEHLDQLAE